MATLNAIAMSYIQPVASLIMESPLCSSHRHYGNAGQRSVSFNLLPSSSTLFCHRYDMAIIQHCLFISTNNNKRHGVAQKNTIIVWLH